MTNDTEKTIQLYREARANRLEIERAMRIQRWINRAIYATSAAIVAILLGLIVGPALLKMAAYIVNMTTAVTGGM